MLTGQQSRNFLSCLSGSELQIRQRPLHLYFLSCLSGSELMMLVGVVSAVFLSCLSGSEPAFPWLNVALSVSKLPERQ